MKKSYVIPPGKGFIDQKFKTIGLTKTINKWGHIVNRLLINTGGWWWSFFVIEFCIWDDLLGDGMTQVFIKLVLVDIFDWARYFWLSSLYHWGSQSNRKAKSNFYKDCLYQGRMYCYICLISVPNSNLHVILCRAGVI